MRSWIPGWSCRRRTAKSLRFHIIEDMFITAASKIRAKSFGSHWVPPTMSALHDNVQVTGIDVLVMLLPIVSNPFPHNVLQLRRNCVLTSIHVCNIRFLQSLGKYLPSSHLDVVSLADVETPYLASGLLQNFEKVQYLFVAHSLVEILNIQSLAICVLFQCDECGIDHNLRCVGIIDVLFHFQNDHVTIVVPKLVEEIPQLFRVQNGFARLSN
mmetsp:Transcript_25510/g.43384  ORF Transcript_25510/g.43384 Transcript_25510/m.43384 type:complete len:213 (-) Transcript_25510:673-1311(-)